MHNQVINKVIQALAFLICLGALLGLLHPGVVCAIHRIRYTLQIAILGAFRNSLVMLMIPAFGLPTAGWLLPLVSFLPPFLWDCDLHLMCVFIGLGGIFGFLTALVFIITRDGFNIKRRYYLIYSTVSGMVNVVVLFLIFPPIPIM